MHQCGISAGEVLTTCIEFETTQTSFDILYCTCLLQLKIKNDRNNLCQDINYVEQKCSTSPLEDLWNVMKTMDIRFDIRCPGFAKMLTCDNWIWDCDYKHEAISSVKNSKHLWSGESRRTASWKHLCRFFWTFRSIKLQYHKKIIKQEKHSHCIE